MSTTNEIVTNIQVPELSRPGYAADLRTAFNDINNNFTTLANHDFVKGEAGTSVSIVEVNVWDNNNGNGKYTQLGEQLKDAIIAGYEKDTSAYDEIAGKKFDENLRNAKLHMIKNGNGDYISSLYFVFLDARYARADLATVYTSQNSSNTENTEQNNLYSSAVDLSCVLIYDKTVNNNEGGFVRLENAFPTMYYVPGTGMCWKLYGEATGIPVAGLPGQKGQSSSINIVKCSTFDSESKQDATNNTYYVLNGTVDSMFVNGEYKSSFTDEDMSEYNGQTVLVIAPSTFKDEYDEDITKTDMFFGVLTAGENNKFTVTTTSDVPWTGYVEEAAVVNLFRNINIYEPNLNSSDTIKLPGLFVPIAPETDDSETGQPAHLITATNINGLSSNVITPDLIIAPVNNVDNIIDGETTYVERTLTTNENNNPIYTLNGTENGYYKWTNENSDTTAIYTLSANPSINDKLYSYNSNTYEESSIKILKFEAELIGINNVEGVDKKGALNIDYDVNIVSEDGNNHNLNVSGDLTVCNNINLGNNKIIGDNNVLYLRSPNVFLIDNSDQPIPFFRMHNWGTYCHKPLHVEDQITININDNDKNALTINTYNDKTSNNKFIDINTLKGFSMYSPYYNNSTNIGDKLRASITREGRGYFGSTLNDQEDQMICSAILGITHNDQLPDTANHTSKMINVFVIPNSKHSDHDIIRCRNYDDTYIMTVTKDGLNIHTADITDNNATGHNGVDSPRKMIELSRIDGTIYAHTLDLITQNKEDNNDRLSLANTGFIYCKEINATNNIYAKAFYQSSDNRLKDFGETIPVDLDKLKTLKKNYFTWKDDNKDNTQIGVSAQEIQEIYPELVNTDENGMLSVAYDKLSVVALAAVDKLHDENKALEKRIKDLEDKFEALLSRINY